MSHTLFITNDFPPRPGGIQTFVYEIVRRFKPTEVTVLTSSWDGCVEFDAQQDYEVVRAKTKVLLPTSETLKLARKLIVEKNIKQVVFGASAPLALLSNSLRELGVERIIAFSHGHEAGWAKTPGSKQAMHKIGEDVDVLTYLTQYTKTEIAKSLSPTAKARMRQLLPAVDPEVFTPKNKKRGQELRTEIGFGDRPTIVSVSRLMARKGHDTLIKALPKIQEHVPDAALVIVGAGSYRKKLEKLVEQFNLTNDVYFAGKVPFADLPAWYATGDVFAMPCRTRNAGWDVEGLGIVFLEASATGIPVVAGDSGGAPEAVADGQSGYVVGGRDESALIKKLVVLLKSPDLREHMGAFGREWVLKNWTWDIPSQRLQAMLSGKDPDSLN